MDTEFECDFHLDEYDPEHEEDLDLEEDYLSRLKIQRKRVSNWPRRSRSCRSCTRTTRTGSEEK